ncbi:MAG: acyltransferase family protein [Pseudomonadota bacterium]
MRRHDLDWLRVLLFGLLVLHHVAVGFSEFGQEVYGLVNDRIAGPGLTLAIYWSHGWRLPALFLIAGIGTWFATARGAGAGFMAERLARLLVPAVFGAFLLNAVAGAAIGWAVAGADGVREVLGRWWTAPELRQVMHLWFLVNLAVYTLLLWPLFGMRDRLVAWEVGPRPLLAALALCVTAVAVVGKPWGAAIAGDGYQGPWYLGLFLGGYLIGARHAAVLDWAARRVRWLLAAGVALYLSEITLLGLALERNPAVAAALASGGWAAEGLLPAYGAEGVAFAMVEGLGAWAWALAALGLAARYLRRAGRWLPELTRGVFPVYVLHFPVMFLGLAALTRLDWPWGWEFLILAAWTYGATAALALAAARTGRAVYLIGGRGGPRPGAPASSS